MYRCDGLTHLLNRAALKNLYPELLKKCSGTMTVILADLDGLKHINDNYGHDDGDYAICAVADALRSCCPQTRSASAGAETRWSRSFRAR